MTLSEVIELLRSASEQPERLPVFVPAFQERVWHDPALEALPTDVQEVLHDLAYDLDFFVPDSRARSEDSSYYGPERAVAEIRAALAAIEQGSAHS